jgi:formylglycine-generating enzyme required for sulfatase activity
VDRYAWLDKEKPCVEQSRNILPGADWEYEIRKAVREADVVVVCLSKQFNQAGFRQKEVRLALDTAMEKPEGEIFIIPARLEECDNLESLRKWHWVDLFEDDGYEMLMRALRVRANKIGATLQIKKNWLPKITTTHPNITKPIEEKRIAQQSTKKQNREGSLSELEREAENLVKNIEREQKVNARKRKLNNFFLDLRHKLNLLLINVQFYIRPILLGIGLTVLLIYLFYLNPRSASPESVTPDFSVTPPRNATTTVATVTETFAPISTPTEVSIPTVTPLPAEITDAKGVKMELVPAGNFIMGSDSGKDDEKPAHTVFLDAFYIDKYEVTNGLYKACVVASACQKPKDTGRYNTAYYDDYPVVFVDWSMANTYCEWRGSQLPTEAQWEKAARGVDGRIFPWGEGDVRPSWAGMYDVACNRANVSDCNKDLTKVGSYESGKSPYDVYDMLGNVSEWVDDWYSETYYQNSPPSNPRGPDSGKIHVLRGSSWYLIPYSITHRSGYDPSNANVTIGFRCARDVNP